MKELTIPISPDTIRSLHTGDTIALTGILATGRATESPVCKLLMISGEIGMVISFMLINPPGILRPAVLVSFLPCLE